jgi:hypothetical protein
VDQSLTFVLIGGVVVALLVVLVVVAVRRERERQRRIRQWAARYGWTVEVNPRVPWVARLPGHERCTVSLLVRGIVRGWPVGVAEYSHTVSSSNQDGSTSRQTYSYLVTTVGLAQRYPPLAVEPRGALSRLGRALFGEGVAATGHDAFDRQFRIRTRHPVVARRVVGPDLIAEHLAGRVPAWSVADHDLLTWRRTNTLLDPEQIPALASPLVRVAELLGH